MYMKSVNAIKGATRIVDRSNVYEDVLDMYRSAWRHCRGMPDIHMKKLWIMVVFNGTCSVLSGRCCLVY